MDAIEQRVWKYILANRYADPLQIARACGVTLAEVNRFLGRIGTPEEIWRNGHAMDWTEAHLMGDAEARQDALSRQVGGDHYANMDVQPWEAMEAWLTPEEYRGYHKGVAIGYLARERSKGGNEDVRKAIHHLQRLVETWGEDGDG